MVKVTYPTLKKEEVEIWCKLFRFITTYNTEELRFDADTLFENFGKANKEKNEYSQIKSFISPFIKTITTPLKFESSLFEDFILQAPYFVVKEYQSKPQEFEILPNPALLLLEENPLIYYPKKVESEGVYEIGEN